MEQHGLPLFKGGNYVASFVLISTKSHLDNVSCEFLFAAVTFTKTQGVVIVVRSRSGVKHELVIVKVRASL